MRLKVDLRRMSGNSGMNCSGRNMLDTGMPASVNRHGLPSDKSLWMFKMDTDGIVHSRVSIKP